MTFNDTLYCIHNVATSAPILIWRLVHRYSCQSQRTLYCHSDYDLQHRHIILYTQCRHFSTHSDMATSSPVLVSIPAYTVLPLWLWPTTITHYTVYNAATSAPILIWRLIHRYSCRSQRTLYCHSDYDLQWHIILYTMSPRQHPFWYGD